jgi:hypothetical protein
MLTDSITGLAVGVFALDFVEPLPVAAARECLPAVRVNGAILGLAVAWCGVFTAAALIALLAGDLAASGFLGAAAELSAAVVIVAVRSRRGVQPEGWAFWEQQMNEVEL